MATLRLYVLSTVFNSYLGVEKLIMKICVQRNPLRTEIYFRLLEPISGRKIGRPLLTYWAIWAPETMYTDLYGTLNVLTK